MYLFIFNLSIHGHELAYEHIIIFELDSFNN